MSTKTAPASEKHKQPPGFRLLMYFMWEGENCKLLISVACRSQP